MPHIQDLIGSTDAHALPALLADRVTFHSPVADYSGRADVAHLFATIGGVLTDLKEGQRYVDGPQTITTLTATVGDRGADGVFIQRLDDGGQLAEATLLLRPYAVLGESIARMKSALAADPLPSMRNE